MHDMLAIICYQRLSVKQLQGACMKNIYRTVFTSWVMASCSSVSLAANPFDDPPQVAAPAQVKAVTPAPATPVSFDKKGLHVSAADGLVKFNVFGWWQLDHRTFMDDSRTSTGNEFRTRRLRPYMELKMFGDLLTYRLTPDFAGPVDRFVYNYLNVNVDPAFQLRFGKFIAPQELETPQPDPATFMIERGLPVYLTSARDVGAMAFGKLFDKQLEYGIAVVHGSPDNTLLDANGDNNYDLAGRLFGYPLKQMDSSWAKCFGVGIGATGGQHEGRTSRSLLPRYPTIGQQTMFSYTGGSYANGTAWRFIPQANCYHGPFAVQTEYVFSGQEVQNAANSRNLVHRAWELSGTYVLTGEDVTYEGITPKEDFNPMNGRYGAFAVAARVSQFIADADSFPVFANPASSVRRANNIGIGFNWWLTYNLGFSANYDFTSFDRGAAAGDRPDEQLVLTRMQVRF